MNLRLFLLERLEAGDVHVRGNDPGAFPRERERGRAADTGRRGREKGRFSSESSCHGFLFPFSCALYSAPMPR